MFGSPLTRAIRRGLKPNADLQVEIRSIGDYSIKSRRDAFAIVEALRSVSRQIARSNSTATIEDLPVFCLAALFQDIESVDVPAFEIMATEGIAELIQIYDEMLHLDTEAHISDLLFMLKIFAMYGSKPGSERIIKAVKRPLAPENYMWGPVLQMFSSDHPSVRSILQRIATPIPPGFIAVSLLDVGNVNSLEHQIEPHPFDTKDGISQLRSWICSSDPDEFSYAHSATAALPFLSSGDRDELLNLSMQHADVGVQIEAAWAAAKLGRSEGIDALVRYCHDVSHSERASHYLQELDLAENIPAETQDETFRARATFANWLAHPNELGSPPDEVEVSIRDN
ncbi:hypothetical protein [Rhodopirellula sp. MGV]|uniref:hypothetical protein n=1 Tax=Rhodopirellula sp. MGV TaxID=2023130 RepID=UPI000B961076|nr:hypothetical protein [Rhodopirellula sp. MGV]OYP34167.1 hypothetical protein CGZ80_16050 [Rhodopirellula sp. MGV]PNY33602.1 hypothetical protein C2E31_27775 [Rhodopirellula baltica]